MVKICNILTDNGLIYMDCYIDGHRNEFFHLVLDESELKVKKTSLCYPNTYALQVIDRIRELRKRGPLPVEAISGQA